MRLLTSQYWLHHCDCSITGLRVTRGENRLFLTHSSYLKIHCAGTLVLILGLVLE